MSEILIVPVGNLKPHPRNPRIIKDDKFQKLVKSLQDFPQMLNKRPLVCYTDPEDGKLIIIGGNQRFKAALELGMVELPVMMADDLTAEQREEFLIKDNLNYGEWEKNMLTEWPAENLDDWGVELPQFQHFTPTFNPGASSGKMTDDKLTDAKNNLESAFVNDRPKFEVCCPECAHIFKIDK